MKPMTYQESGVDPDKAARILGAFGNFLKSRPRDPNILSGIGPFASCYSLKEIVGDLRDPVLVTCCDGVGTKLKLALDWNRLTGLGRDLVAMNVNDLICVGAKPLLFLDYYACGRLEETQLSTLLKDIQGGCESALCSLVGGETAEMPGVYAKSDFDLAGFAVGILDRPNMLGPERVHHNDVLIALKSSGFHSNGYSLVRKIAEKEGLNPEAKPPFDSRSWKDCLLAPTTIYVSAILDQLDHVHALAHITGGGLFENLPRVLPPGARAIVRSESWEIPEMFLWFQSKAEITTHQLLSTFNCGVGMLAVVPPEASDVFQSGLAKHGIESHEVGTIELSTATTPAEVLWQ
jgi:phosphoribosylformylglycinamidine cyclo-ligase